VKTTSKVIIQRYGVSFESLLTSAILGGDGSIAVPLCSKDEWPDLELEVVRPVCAAEVLNPTWPCPVLAAGLAVELLPVPE
jgi:hypothetical protein